MEARYRQTYIRFPSRNRSQGWLYGRLAALSLWKREGFFYMSLKVMSNRAAAEARQQHAFEAYHAYERQRLKDDELTWAAETLDGPVRVPLEFTLKNNDLYASDGGNLRTVFEDAVSNDMKVAAVNTEYGFQLQRSRAELGEYEHMVMMAKGEVPNVMVVISPIPEQMRGRTSGDTYGYQPRRGLGFFRVISHEGDGRIKMTVQSFDKSDPVAINAMYSRYGEQPDWSRDLIDQRIYMHIEDELERELISDSLLFRYDESLNQRYGGDWYAGRNGQDRRNAYDFAKIQADLLDEHISRMSRPGLDDKQKEKFRRDYAAALRRRHEGRQVTTEGGGADAEMSAAGDAALAAGERFEGCGYSVGGANSAEAQAAQAGYSNRLWVRGECRVCLRSAEVAECTVCIDCEEADNRGEDLDRIHARAKTEKAMAAKALSVSKKSDEDAKKEAVRHARQKSRPGAARVRTADGRMLHLRHKLVIGGTKPVWVDEQGREAARS